MASGPPSEFLLTPEELQILEGKYRCVTRLRNHPRSTLPEVKTPLSNLIEGLIYLIIAGQVKYNVPGRQLVDLGLRNLKKLEDIVIRVLVIGETFENAEELQLKVVQQVHVTESSL